MKQASPIFFAITRSFWAAMALLALMLDAALLAIQDDPEAASIIANVIASFIGLETATVEPVLRAFVPVLGLFIAQQRMGASRPYTARIDGDTIR